MWRVCLALAVSGCSPFTGFAIEKHSSEPEAVLPIRCSDRLDRTTGGLWICKNGDRLVTSGGQSIRAEKYGVAGSAVWVINNTLERYADDAGVLEKSPDAGYDWNEFTILDRGVRAFLPHERDIVLSLNELQLIGVADGGFEQRPSKTPPFFQSSIHLSNSGEAFVENRSIIWAVGPGNPTLKLCPLRYSETEGITAALSCTDAGIRFIGSTNGGFWMELEQERPLRFFRPADSSVSIVPEIELPPKIEWKGLGGVLWIEVDPSTIHVVDVDGVEKPRVVLDEYKASEGHAWAGVNERWVFETPTDGSESTRVYAR